MKILPYSKQSINSADINFVKKSLKNDLITQGEYINKLEKAICKKLKVKYALAVSSATAGLHLSNMLFKKKKILTQSLTFASTVSTIIFSGNIPVLSDIDPTTLLLEPKNLQKNQFDIIVNVLFAGSASNSIELRTKFKKKIIIEDASHALGGKYPDQSYIGSCKHSDICIFSLHPVKSITSGEGGIITTNNKTFYEKLKILRNHGIIREKVNKKVPWMYKINNIGLNYRMNEMQAALALSQLKKLDKFIEKRKKITKIYDAALQKNIKIYLPQSNKFTRQISAQHLYIINIKNITISKKIQFIKKLKKCRIGSQVHYIPVHKFKAFQNVKKIGSLQNTEKHYRECLSIPCYFDLNLNKVKFIANKINKILENE